MRKRLLFTRTIWRRRGTRGAAAFAAAFAAKASKARGYAEPGRPLQIRWRVSGASKGAESFTLVYVILAGGNLIVQFDVGHLRITGLLCAKSTV
jgi:hypothetical protein